MTAKEEEKIACKEGILMFHSFPGLCLVIGRVNSGFGKRLLLLLPYESFNIGKRILQRVQLLIVF